MNIPPINSKQCASCIFFGSRWILSFRILKDNSSLQESTGNHITVYSPLRPCTKQNLHKLRLSLFNCFSEQNKCSNTNNGPTATERWCGHLNSWARPFNKLHWLITGEAKWCLFIWNDIFRSALGAKKDVFYTYSNFMLTEWNFQKHTIPSAPVEPRYRVVPLTAGQNYRNRGC